MFSCPYCNQSSITWHAKLRSGAWVPARCKECGKPSAILPWIGGVVGVVLFLLFIVALGFAFLWLSWWPLVAFGVFWLAIEVVLVNWVPLAPIKERQRA